jgi:hypothetical protein
VKHVLARTIINPASLHMACYFLGKITLISPPSSSGLILTSAALLNLSGPCEKNTPSRADVLGGLGGDEFSHRSGFQSDQ